MVYLFEDDKISSMSSLFKRIYKDSHTDRSIKFVGGNNKFEVNIKKPLDAGQSICIYIDVIFDNIDTIKRYSELVKKYQDDAVAVIPVACMEYYMVRYVSTLSELVVDGSYIQLCNNMNPEYKDICAKSGHVLYSFETFCKAVLEHSFRSCIRQGKPIRSDKCAKKSFYKLDCSKCLQSDCNYRHLTLLDKSNSLVTTYDVFPELPGFEPVSKSDLENYIIGYLSLLMTKVERGSYSWLLLRKLMKENLVGQKWIWTQSSQDIWLEE